MRPWQAASAACAVLLLAACTPGDGASPADGPAPFAVDVDVDTPELRQLKRDAGVEPCPASGRGPAEDGLPEVTLACLGGGTDVDLAGLRGPLVLNLWASWCGPCREELPYYQQLHEQAGDRLDVVGLDYQDTMPGQALALAKATGVTYPLVADPGAEVRVPFRVRGLPGLVLVDATGRVVHREYVAVDSYAQLAGLVAEHLGVDVEAAG